VIQGPARKIGLTAIGVGDRANKKAEVIAVMTRTAETDQNRYFKAT
jgi:hypothetical protein